MVGRLRAVVLICGALVSLGALAWGHRLEGNHKFVDKPIEVGAFHAVRVRAGIHVELSVGPDRSVVVHAEENIQPLVAVEVSHGTLEIGWVEHSSHSDHGVTVQVAAAEVDELEASGGASIEGEVAKSDTLDVDVSGGGELHLRGVDARALTASGSGAATLELRGKAEQLKLDASGATRFPLEKLAVREARIDASGGCEGALQASGLVKGEISGGVSLRVTGGAKTRVSSSGGSSVDVD